MVSPHFTALLPRQKGAVGRGKDREEELAMASFCSGNSSHAGLRVQFLSVMHKLSLTQFYFKLLLTE
jgi:hypothetical protein